MSYVALYRRYRPRDFEEIVGQQPIITTLKNQIKSGKIGHAYLFCGMRGTGKTSTARVFAKALNCQQGPTVNPCNECPSCRAINSGNMMDVIEMDAASNRGIDDIRDLRDSVNFPPSEGRYKIYIIDEVHMLTTEAFNALLKTLEEPPRHVVFILATTEPNKLPATILSRCMRFDFRRVSAREIVGRMKEIAGENGINADEKALMLIARNSQGSVRDALSLLDKAFAFGGEKFSYEDALSLLGAVSRDVFYRALEAVYRRDCARLLDVVEEVAAQGKDLLRFMDDLLEHFRNILVIRLGGDRSLVDVADEDYDELKKIAENYSVEKLLSIIDILKNASSDLKWSSQPRIVLEASLAKLTLPELWEGDSGMAGRIQVLEERVEKLQEEMQKLIGTMDGVRAQSAAMEDAGRPFDVEGEASSPLKAEEVGTAVSQEEEKTEEPCSGVNGAGAGVNQGEAVSEPEGRPALDDKAVLSEIMKSWPAVIQELERQRKMTLVSFINAGNIRPGRMEKNKLYLYYNGNSVYKEKVEAEKHIIEETVKKIAGFDTVIKGFEQEPPDGASGGEKGKSGREIDPEGIESAAPAPNFAPEESGEGAAGSKKNSVIEFVSEKENEGGRADIVREENASYISDEQFYQNVINFFGEDIVEIL
ncbi:DNA polymerase III subunit gamma/tau [Thermoanaerobacterium sp. DL9XJH110]|uniref:DNA polymerase III subunit gamma/tau n=1 Tax=Thermoanaerobacterium sp. DL9XJH110 TaxID=3386643 RepID=UPI003BB6DDC8